MPKFILGLPVLATTHLPEAMSVETPHRIGIEESIAQEVTEVRGGLEFCGRKFFRTPAVRISSSVLARGVGGNNFIVSAGADQQEVIFGFLAS